MRRYLAARQGRARCANGYGGWQRRGPRDCKALLRLLRQKTHLMGDVGSGQLTKMVNQISIPVLQGLSEGVHFASKQVSMSIR